LEAVGIAGLSAFVVNVAASSLFYGPLFRKRLTRLTAHIDDLLLKAAGEGPSGLVVAFPHITEMSAQLSQALKEVKWRGNKTAQAELSEIAARVARLQDIVHLSVNLEYSLPGDSPEVRVFLAWLPKQEGPPPELPEPAQQTRERVLALLA
jgi:hypothetical protein